MEIEIFTQAFLTRLLPTQHEVALTALRNFHPDQYPYYAMFAGLGAVLASAVFYAIGVWLRRLPDKISTEEQKNRIALMHAFAIQWLPWLLILAPTPMGRILVMAAGFFAIRPWRAAWMIVAAEVLWRASPVL